MSYYPNFTQKRNRLFYSIDIYETNIRNSIVLFLNKNNSIIMIEIYNIISI